MQPSSLSRNFLYAPGASSSFNRCVMMNDGSISPCSIRFSSGLRYRCVCVWPILKVNALFIDAVDWPMTFFAISALGLELSQQEKSCFLQKKHDPQAMLKG